MNQAVYHKAPDYMREGGSIPVTLTFAEALGVNVLLLPMGRGDDGAQYVSIELIKVNCRDLLLDAARRTKN
jgi:Cys-Gly metallodipeptidase DUG1